MSDRWLWGTLDADARALAQGLADRWLENVDRFNVAQHRYAHTPDAKYQNLIGAQGEIAFCVLTDRPLPTIEAASSTWHAADVDGYAIKTVTKRHYRLLFDDADLTGAHSLVLMLNECPLFAIVGQITVPRALERRQWATNLPRACWAIPQTDLAAWE